MIRSLIVLALWAALPTPAQVGSAALYTNFEQTPAVPVVHALHEEVDSLMAQSGLHFEWRSLPEQNFATWTDLAVVKFSGRCDVLPFAPNSQIDQRLGWTHLYSTDVLPFAEVDCDAVRAFINRQLLALPAQSRQKVLGRALGRVVAHELLHIFARSTAHSDHGVDQPFLTVSDLMADHLDLSQKEAAIVRASPAPSMQAREGSPAVGKASYEQAGCATCHGANGEGSRRGPALHFSDRGLNAIMLAAKLAKSQPKMCQRARNLNVAPPSISEDDLPDLVRFLSEH